MNLQKMLKQAQEMQNRMAEMQAKLAEEQSEGASGSGMVKVVLNGKGAMLKISLDPSLLVPDDKEVLEDLIVAAFNDAKNKADANMAGQMEKLTAGMGLPPGMKLPF